MFSCLHSIASSTIPLSLATPLRKMFFRYLAPLPSHVELTWGLYFIFIFDCFLFLDFNFGFCSCLSLGTEMKLEAVVVGMVGYICQPHPHRYR